MTIILPIFAICKTQRTVVIKDDFNNCIVGWTLDYGRETRPEDEPQSVLGRFALYFVSISGKGFARKFCMFSGFLRLIVIFEPEVRDQLFAPQVSKSVLEFHQLDEDIVFRI